MDVRPLSRGPQRGVVVEFDHARAVELGQAVGPFGRSIPGLWVVWIQLSELPYGIYCVVEQAFGYPARHNDVAVGAKEIWSTDTGQLVRRWLPSKDTRGQLECVHWSKLWPM